MGVLEIIGGVALIICAVGIIFFVALQTEKSDGLSGAIMGNVNLAAGKARTNEEKLAKLTKVLGAAFVVLCLLVNVFCLINNK